MNNKPELPQQDYFQIEDIIRLWGISESQLHHYVCEQQSVRLALVNNGSDKLKCIKLSDKQYRILDSIFADMILSKSEDGTEWISDIGYKDLNEIYQKKSGVNLSFKKVQNCPKEVYFNPDVYLEVLETNSEGAFRISKALCLFENFAGEKCIFVSVGKGVDTKIDVDSFVLAGVMIEQLCPVITALEKSRFEKQEPKAVNKEGGIDSDDKPELSDKTPGQDNNLNTKEHVSNLIDGAQISTEQAAEYLGYSPHTLRNARFTGMLADVKPPEYRKAGRKIFYEKSTLDKWKIQFKKRSNTSEQP